MPPILRFAGRGSLPEPTVMGILNVTPDSFFDGGRFDTVEAAAARAREMVRAGAGVVDIGAESTRPGAASVPSDLQLDRLLPVLDALRDPHAPQGPLPVPISIDPTCSKVAREVLARGAEIINDVTGGEADPAIFEAVAEADAAIVLMHMRGTPRDMQQRTDYEDVVEEVTRHLAMRCEAATAAGIPPDHQAVDPGIGFSKTPEGCVELIGRLGELRALGRPILLGASRKSFLGRRFGLEGEGRLHGSVASAVMGLVTGASIFRVHDVAATVDALRVAAGVTEFLPRV